jgi:phosphosulfolactate synthase (CoM biosynthesis protein A)
MGPAHSEKCDADMVVVVNDDTMYPPNMVNEFLKLYEEEACCWCTSGFVVDDYVKNNGLVARYDRQEIDVTESYGGVLLKMEWLRAMKDEFLNYYALTYNDDIIISNLLSKMGIKRKSSFNAQLNIGMIKQYSFGMGEDALFQNNGDGSHFKNNKQVFQMLKDKNKYFY